MKFLGKTSTLDSKPSHFSLQVSQRVPFHFIFPKYPLISRCLVEEINTSPRVDSVEKFVNIKPISVGQLFYRIHFQPTFYFVIPKEEEICGRRHANPNPIPSPIPQSYPLLLFAFGSLRKVLSFATLKKKHFLSLGLWPRSVFFEVWGRGRLT